MTVPHIEVFQQRRARLLQAMREHPMTQASGGDAVLVLFSHPVHLRNGDVDHDYRADSDIAYLTGFSEPECALVLAPGRGDGECVMFVRPRDKDMEIWNGRRHGPEGAKAVFGVDEAHEIGTLGEHLPRLLKDRRCAWGYFGARGDEDARVFGAIATARRRSRRKGSWPTAFGDASLLLHPMRLKKDDLEVSLLEQAAKATAAGHRRAMAVTRPGLSEADLQAVLDFEFRRGGAARHGYNPIVAAGANACILHYVENDAPLKDGELVLIDAGAEHGMYTADVTRTWPIGGKFSEPQRRLYDLVLAAEEAAIAEAKPGATQKGLDELARRVLAKGLVELGLLSGEIDKLIEKRPFDGMPEAHPGKAPLDRFYMHSTGHWLGSDVHDVGAYHDGEAPTPLEPGMVFTIEPGLYVAPDDEAAPAEYRGIGIRIEDDVLITADGCRVLTADIPKKPDEVEALVGTETL
jgi:Xaa-Pro aminopeptidase